MVFSDLFFIFVFLPSFVVIYLIAAWLDKKVFFRQKEGVILFDDDPHKSGYQRPRIHRTKHRARDFLPVILCVGRAGVYLPDDNLRDNKLFVRIVDSCHLKAEEDVACNRLDS